MNVKLRFVIPVAFCLLLIMAVACNPPANTFAFGPTPQGGQIGGISGVFVHEDSLPPDTGDSPSRPCDKIFYLLRFYSDGLVLSVSTCLPGSVSESWSDIKKWFHRDGGSQIARGEYYTLGNRIWFSVTGQAVTIDYSGTYSENTLILDLYSHYNGHESAGDEYVQIEVDQQE